MKTDIYAKITNTIVAQLEKGVRPWQLPWNAAYAGSITRPLRYNGDRYNGINVLTLWSEAVEKNYTSPFWMTFKQAALLNAHVRKGEHGVCVVYSNKLIRTEKDEAIGEIKRERVISYIKAYYVYNAEQIEGLPDHFYAKPAQRINPIIRIDRAEMLFANLGVEIRHGGHLAFCDLINDYVKMPPFEVFRDAEAYYSTLAHECTHWTGHASRLDRKLNPRFEEKAYAMEELVAELGAAFLCADLDLAPEPRDDHAAYIGNWIEALKNDKRAVFAASSQAQRAADFLHSLQAKTVTTEPD